MSWTSLRVPASSANLGPGFDALGLALTLYLDCRFRRADDLRITISGCDADSIPADCSNLIWLTALSIAAREGHSLPPCELAIHNEIPLGKGLGSSAAALTAGVAVANELLNLRWDRSRILNEIARIEGHPDNVAASVWGGVVASAMDENGCVSAVRIPLNARFEIAVVVPGLVLPTSESRAALPDAWPRRDVIFNLQRTALLTAALAASDLDALATALCDRLHHSYRAPLIPGLAEVLQLKAEGLLGCVLSGAGPSVMVFFRPDCHEVCGLVQDAFTRAGVGATVLRAEIAAGGYELGSTLSK